MLLAMVIINLFDIIIILLLSEKLVDSDVLITPQKVIVGVIYALTLGAAAYFLDGYTYRIITTTVDIFMIYLITKRKFTNVILLYAIMFTMMAIIHAPLVGLQEIVQIDQFIAAIIMQTVGLITVFIIYWKAPLDKFLKFIESKKRIRLRRCIEFAALIFIILAFYTIFEPSIVNFIFLPVILGMLVIKVLYDIVHANIKIQKQRDFYDSAYGLFVKAYCDGCHSEIKRLQELYATHVLIAHQDSLQLGKVQENILAIIDILQSARGDNVEAISDINYFEEHREVGIDTVVKMLVILLNHALRNEMSKPIFIKSNIKEREMNMSVSYEYHLTDSNALHKMFDDDKLNEENDEQGHGFNYLSKLVRKLGGKVNLAHNYNENEQVPYLEISIKI